MKTHSDDLFRLIKSLDTQEKIFFKKYSIKRGFKKDSLSYVQLFDTIDKLKTYNESFLSAELKKVGFKNRLSKAKKYLNKAILNSLREYHSDTSVNSELQKLLHQAEILIKKKLIVAAKKTIRKAEQLALRHELYDYLIVICSLKTSVRNSNRHTKDIEDHLNHGVEQEKKYMERLKNTIELNNLASQIQLISYSFTAIDKKIISQIDSILDSPLLSSPDKSLSFSALRCYYNIHFSCALILDKWDEATYKRHKEWISYIESDKLRFADRIGIYFGDLNNLMLIQIKMSKMKEADRSFEKIKSCYFSLTAKKRTKTLLESVIGAASNCMAIYALRGNPEKSLNIWEQIKDSISLNKLNQATILTIYDNLSGIYFALGKYHDAMAYVNKIHNFGENDRLDIQAMSRVYTLLIYYELGKHEVFPYVAKSSKRFLVKHNYFSEFEKIMLAFFEKKIFPTKTIAEQIDVFTELKKQLATLIKGNKQVQALKYFDYMSWINSKIENRPFIEIIQRKNQKSLN